MTKNAFLLLFNLIFIGVSAQQCYFKFSGVSTDYTLGTTQLDVTSADFNGDGYLDLATANYTSSSISLLFGTAGGTFTSITNFSSNIISPSQIVSADFNGDGKADLVTTNSNLFAGPIPYCDTVSILLGNGAGSFSPTINFTVANNSMGIVTADFNTDGKMDLVISNGTDLKLLLGSGTGLFSAPVTFTTPGNPVFMAAKDLNSDGKPDIAIATQTNTLAVLFGNGIGSFSSPLLIAHSNTTLSLLTIAAGDFNNDGIEDLVTGTDYPSRLITFLGTGAGSFTPGFQFIYPFSLVSRDILANDFNMDGNLDVAVGDVSGTVYFGLNPGSGNFISSGSSSAGGDHRGIISGDFNSDGKPDFAVTNASSSTFYASVFLNITIIPSVSVTTTSSLICAGETVTLTASGASTFTWSGGETVPTITISPVTTANFTIIGAGNSNCRDTLIVEQKVEDCTGIDKNEVAQSFQLYPNPTTAQITIKLNNNSEDNSVEIYNSLGQSVCYYKLENAINTFDFNDFNQGIYFVKVIQNGKADSLLKLIKE